MEYEVLNIVDELDDIEFMSEMAVMDAMLDVYTKQATMLCYMPQEVVQESFKDDINVGIKGVSGESVLKKILLFIPRLVVTITKRISQFIKDLKSKKLDKSIDDAKNKIDELSDEEFDDFTDKLKKVHIVNESDSPELLINIAGGLRDGKIYTNFNSHIIRRDLLGYENFVEITKLAFDELIDSHYDPRSSGFNTGAMDFFEKANTKVINLKTFRDEFIYDSSYRYHDIKTLKSNLFDIANIMDKTAENLFSLRDRVTDNDSEYKKAIDKFAGYKGSDWNKLNILITKIIDKLKDVGSYLLDCHKTVMDEYKRIEAVGKLVDKYKNNPTNKTTKSVSLANSDNRTKLRSHRRNSGFLNGKVLPVYPAREL